MRLGSSIECTALVHAEATCPNLPMVSSNGSAWLYLAPINAHRKPAAWHKPYRKGLGNESSKECRPPQAKSTYSSTWLDFVGLGNGGSVDEKGKRKQKAGKRKPPEVFCSTRHCLSPAAYFIRLTCFCGLEACRELTLCLRPKENPGCIHKLANMLKLLPSSKRPHLYYRVGYSLQMLLESSKEVWLGHCRR
eukprot:318395-Pelagomonas_calceolata.AAC.4